MLKENEPKPHKNMTNYRVSQPSLLVNAPTRSLFLVSNILIYGNADYHKLHLNWRVGNFMSPRLVADYHRSRFEDFLRNYEYCACQETWFSCLKNRPFHLLLEETFLLHNIILKSNVNQLGTVAVGDNFQWLSQHPLNFTAALGSGELAASATKIWASFLHLAQIIATNVVQGSIKRPWFYLGCIQPGELKFCTIVK